MPFIPSSPDPIDMLTTPSPSRPSLHHPLSSSLSQAQTQPLPNPKHPLSSFPSSPPSASAPVQPGVQDQEGAKDQYERWRAINKERHAERKRMRESRGVGVSQAFSSGSGSGSIQSSGSISSVETQASSISISLSSPKGNNQSSQASRVSSQLPNSRSNSALVNHASDPILAPSDNRLRTGEPTVSPTRVIQTHPADIIVSQPEPLVPLTPTVRPSIPVSQPEGQISSHAGSTMEDIEEDDDTALKRLMQEAETRLRPNPHAQVVETAVRVSDNLDRADSRLYEIESGDRGVGGQGAVWGTVILTDAENGERQKAITFLENMFLRLVDDIVRSAKIKNEREMSGGSTKRKGNGNGVGRGKRKLEGDDDDDDDEDEGEGDDGDPERDTRKGGGGTRKNEAGIELRLKNRTTGEDQVISYPDDPGAMKKETALHKLSCRYRVAELLYEAVLTQVVTTKRDTYYKDVNLFKTQAVVDKIVDDLVATAGLKRQDFMVCAASKGLVASSSLRIHLKNGEELSLSSANASLIPPIERIGHVEMQGGVSMVLIVEKDAVFQTLLSLRLLNQPGLERAVLITGKGYPDLATLQLCKLISTTYPSAKFHALVDADPHGIDIMQVYAKGSKSTTHSYDHANLALGARLSWMGVKASEWIGLGVRHDNLLMLSDKDVEKAMAMLRRKDLPLACKRELQCMLHLNRKAEIQILSSIGGNTDTLESVYSGSVEGGGRRGSDTGNKVGLLGYVIERLLAI